MCWAKESGCHMLHELTTTDTVLHQPTEKGNGTDVPYNQYSMHSTVCYVGCVSDAN